MALLHVGFPLLPAYSREMIFFFVEEIIFIGERFRVRTRDYTENR
jgi:hypothetical protein